GEGDPRCVHLAGQLRGKSGEGPVELPSRVGSHLDPEPGEHLLPGGAHPVQLCGEAQALESPEPLQRIVELADVSGHRDAGGEKQQSGSAAPAQAEPETPVGLSGRTSAATPRVAVALYVADPRNVLAALARAGVVASTQGRGGGYRLAWAPEAITLHQIVEAV